MKKTIYSEMGQLLHEKLVEIRKKAGFTQRQLAQKLGREPSFVARIELGERRVDLPEFYLICKACNASSERVIKDLLREFTNIDVDES